VSKSNGMEDNNDGGDGDDDGSISYTKAEDSKNIEDSDDLSVKSKEKDPPPAEDARAYAAAMLTVANVSESLAKQTTHNTSASSIPAPSLTEDTEDDDLGASSGATFIDKRYVARLDNLPPALINALLHEEAMLAAEKAALEGKDRHIFDISEAAELSAEVQQAKIKTLQEKSKKNSNLGVVGSIKKWFAEQREIIRMAKIKQEKEYQNKIIREFKTGS